MHDVVVIGAGPAGLGTAAQLSSRGIRALVLERGNGVGNKWRQSYDALRINTSAWFSYLPGRRIRSKTHWPHRDELVSYYEAYAAEFGLDVEFDCEALRLDLSDDHWIVQTSRDECRTRSVVIATAKDHTPELPDWPGADMFPGHLLHSSEYRNAAAFKGLDVLVVGAGNSAFDIALDLLSAGNRVSLSVRTPPHITRRSILGIPNDFLAVAARRLPDAVVDRAARLMRRLTLGDLDAYGLAMPEDGIATHVRKTGMIPTIDPGGFVHAVRRGKLPIVAGVERFDGDEVALTDGRRVRADVVVAATGYRTGLETLVGHLGVLDERAYPVVHGSDTHPRAPRLHFIGFTHPISGNLRELRLDAKRIANALAREIAQGLNT